MANQSQVEVKPSVAETVEVKPPQQQQPPQTPEQKVQPQQQQQQDAQPAAPQPLLQQEIKNPQQNDNSQQNQNQNQPSQQQQQHQMNNQQRNQQRQNRGNRGGGNQGGGNQQFGNRGNQGDGGGNDNMDGGDGGQFMGNRGNQMQQGGGGGGMGNQGQRGQSGGRNRNDRRDRGDRGGGGGGGMGMGGGDRDNKGGGRDYRNQDEYHINQRLRAIAGPSLDLPSIDTAEETKFSGRNRLYVGNLTNDITEAELIEMFAPYGEISEVFCNADKNFTFLKVDYHANAEKAKRELDGKLRKGRQLRVRFAPNSTILRVSNLTPFVSNELLHKAFEVFGPVERALVTVDDRGKTTGHGIVEFVKKASANACVRYCNEKCFFLTSSLRPCVVEIYESTDDPDGLPEKSLNHKSSEYNDARSVGPHVADLGSFEHEYGSKWKQLHELYNSKVEALKRELKAEEEKLEAQMEYARFEHETELLRQELRKRESDNERKKMEWEMREKQAEEIRQRDEENMLRQTNEMQSRMMRQDEEMRRRQQENTLFMQAQQLNSLLDQTEGFNNNNSGGGSGGGGGNFGNNMPFDFRGNYY